MSPATGLPSTSVTFAVAVVVDEPLAAMIGADSETVTLVAGPAANAAGASSNAPTAPTRRQTPRRLAGSPGLRLAAASGASYATCRPTPW